jgi:hypothetical protein
MVDELAIKYNWSQDTRDKYLLTLKAAKKTPTGHTLILED